MERIRDAIQKARLTRGGTDDEILGGPPDRGRGGRSDKAALEAAWESLPELAPDAKLFARNRIVTYACEDPSYIPFDIMRTKVLSSLKQNGWKSLAITSPSPDCGKTTIATNLAFSFARQKELRTILIDVDLRRPYVAKALGLPPGPSVAAFLTGTADSTSQFVRIGMNLAIGAAAKPHAGSSEILANSQTRRSLEALYGHLKPDVVIFDLPPLGISDDALAFLPNADCALLVVEAERSSFREVDQTEQELAEKSNLLGVVLNKCRFNTESYGYQYN